VPKQVSKETCKPVSNETYTECEHTFPEDESVHIDVCVCVCVKHSQGACLNTCTQCEYIFSRYLRRLLEINSLPPTHSRKQWETLFYTFVCQKGGAAPSGLG
jgi:hypothetical protein